jgi:hypothetical protein
MDDVYWPHVQAETAAGNSVYVGESRQVPHLIGAYWSSQELRERPTELRSTANSAMRPLRDWMRRSKDSRATGWLGATRPTVPERGGPRSPVRLGHQGPASVGSGGPGDLSSHPERTVS